MEIPPPPPLPGYIVELVLYEKTLESQVETVVILERYKTLTAKEARSSIVRRFAQIRAEYRTGYRTGFIEEALEEGDADLAWEKAVKYYGPEYVRMGEGNGRWAGWIAPTEFLEQSYIYRGRGGLPMPGSG